jgi:hypothetical protein
MTSRGGFGAGGKKIMTNERRRKPMERRLIGRPQRPRLKCEGRSGSRRMRFSAMQEMETM